MDPVFLVLPLVVAAIVSFCVVKVFEKPITSIFSHIVKAEISRSFLTYVKLVTYLVGISRGASIFQLYEDASKVITNIEDIYDIKENPYVASHGCRAYMEQLSERWKPLSISTYGCFCCSHSYTSWLKFWSCWKLNRSDSDSRTCLKTR